MKYLKKAWLVLVIAMISMTFLGNTAVIIDNQPEYVEVEESIESEYVSEQAITDELLGNLSILENYLETNGTNMMIEAQKQIDLYTYIANEAEIEEEREKAILLVNGTYRLLAEYQQYNQVRNENDNTATVNGLYETTVLAALTTFNELGYVLSAELLTFASESTIPYVTYRPIQGYIVSQSSYFNEIVQSATLHGSKSWNYSFSNVVDGDIYCALRNVEYWKTPCKGRVMLIDVYDFAYTENATSALDVAVNLIYRAQEAGIISNYYVEIIRPTEYVLQNQSETLTLTSISNRRLYEDFIVLAAGKHKQYTVTFADAGSKLVQTFGNLDTRLYIYDSNDYLIASDDDGGYDYNAFVRFNAVAGETYKIRVRCAYTDDSGGVRLVITPTERVKNSSSQSLATYDDIYSITGFTGYTFYSYVQPNLTTVIKFTPPQTGTYKVELESVFSNFLYVIDPTSNRLAIGGYNIEALYGNYGSTGAITSKLKAGVPYFIVYSQYNVATPLINLNEGDDITVRITKTG